MIEMEDKARREKRGEESREVREGELKGESGRRQSDVGARVEPERGSEVVWEQVLREGEKADMVWEQVWGEEGRAKWCGSRRLWEWGSRRNDRKMKNGSSEQRSQSVVRMSIFACLRFKFACLSIRSSINPTSPIPTPPPTPVLFLLLLLLLLFIHFLFLCFFSYLTPNPSSSPPPLFSFFFLLL